MLQVFKPESKGSDDSKVGNLCSVSFGLYVLEPEIEQGSMGVLLFRIMIPMKQL